MGERERRSEKMGGEVWGREEWSQKRLEGWASTCFSERPLMPNQIAKIKLTSNTKNWQGATKWNAQTLLAGTSSHLE